MRLAYFYILRRMVRRMVFQQLENGLFTWNFLSKTFQNIPKLFLSVSTSTTYQNSTKTFHNSIKSVGTQLNTFKTCIRERFRFKYSHTPLITCKTNSQQLEITLEVILDLLLQHLRNSTKVQSSFLIYKLLKPLKWKQENIILKLRFFSVFG